MPPPVINVSSATTLSAPSSGGEASCFLWVCDFSLRFLHNSFLCSADKVELPEAEAHVELFD
jgi:hypothetical protein